MEDIIKYVDFYDTDVTLSYKNTHYYKTLFGGILSIITFVSVLIITSIFSKSVFTKQNFKIISTSSINESSSFDFSKLPLLVGLANSNGVLMSVDERLFNIIITEYHLSNTIDENGNNNISISDKEFGCENCEKYRGNKSYFLNNTFENFELSRFQCIKPGQNLTFFGKYKDSINGYRGVRIIVNKCNNDTLKSKNKNTTCYPEEIINSKLLNVKIFTYYTGYNVNHYSFDDNHIYYIEAGYYSRLSSSVFKSYEISFTKNIYISDDSILFNRKTRKEYFTPSGSHYDEFDREALNFGDSKKINQDTIGVVSFFLDGEEKKHDRSFDSILDVFINLGGISNLITIIFGVTNKYITRRSKKIDLIETLLFEPNSVKRAKSSGISRINDIKNNNSNINKIIRDKSNSNNNILLINSSKMNFVTNMKSRSVFKKTQNQTNNIEGVFFNNIIRYRDYRDYSINKNNMDSNLNRNTINFSCLSKVELKEKFKKLGKKIIFFYLLPSFISNRCDKINFIEKLFVKVNENLSIERIYKVLKEWINIKEKILSIESLFQE